MGHWNVEIYLDEDIPKAFVAASLRRIKITKEEDIMTRQAGKSIRYRRADDDQADAKMVVL